MEKTLKTLEIYNVATELSDKSRVIFSSFDYGIKKIIWDQFIRAVDSIGANIAEWYWRYHYLDSIRFYYHARWSLLEAEHWLILLQKRGLIDESTYDETSKLFTCLVRKLNNFISAVRKQSTVK